METKKYVITIIITTIAVILILATLEIDFSNQKNCPANKVEYKYLFTDNEESEQDYSTCDDEIYRLNNELRDLQKEFDDYICKKEPNKCD